MSPIPESVVPFTKYGRIYDFLLKDELDYDGDCNFIEIALAKLGPLKPLRILDIGCGTGEHAIRLVKRGYQVTGIDASAEMINEAIEKAKTEGLQVEFFVQDLKRIELNQILTAP